MRDIGIKVEEIHQLLKEGKKIKCSNKLFYIEDFNDKKSGFSSSQNIKRTEIDYIYTNPQYNRMFARLVDGRIEDYDIAYMDLFWDEFTEYVPKIEMKKEFTLEESLILLGFPKESLVNENLENLKLDINESEEGKIEFKLSPK